MISSPHPCPVPHEAMVLISHWLSACVVGMLGASFGLAFVVGPALGGLLMKYDLWLPTKVRKQSTHYMTPS